MAVSKRLRFEILRRDNHTCRYCGRSAPEVQLVVDHVLAVALGGTDEAGNLVAACSECNGGKSATPAGAAMVDDVKQDALRWANAMRVAGDHLMERLAVRDRLRAKFEATWNGWTVNATGKPPPLPDSWTNTVDNLLRSGLPLEALLDCVEVAMRTEVVEVDNLFRYACGVAWNRVADIQRLAAGIVGDGSLTALAGVPLVSMPMGITRDNLRDALTAALDGCDPPLEPWVYDQIVLDALDATFGPAAEVDA